MKYRIRIAVPKDEQKIRELFMEMMLRFYYVSRKIAEML